jgi:hypothetical protein
MSSILTPAQRRFLRWFLGLAIFVLANSAFLFFAHRRDEVTAFYQWMLLGHLAGGALLLLLATFFVVWHLRNERVRNRLRARAGITGAGLTAAAYALFATGIFILSQANSREHFWVFQSHRVLAVLAPALYAFHRLVATYRPERAATVRGAVAFAGLFLLMLGLHSVFLPPPESPRIAERRAGDPFVPFVARNFPPQPSPFAPSSVTTDSGRFFPSRVITRGERGDFARIEADVRKLGFAADTTIGSETCERCHPDTVAQWKDSAHRFASFNNPFYRAAVEKFRETKGKEPSQWCAGCHDPSIMLAGNMTKEIDPLTPESQAGLTCLACHVIDRIHGLEGNGNYHVADERPSPYLGDGAASGVAREVADLLIKSKPAVHKAQMKKPFFTRSEFCATCHKVSIDVPVNGWRFFRGQNEYDAWHDSGVSLNAARTFYLPGKAKQCQDCHMPPEPAPLGDVSAKGGKVRSHRFLAVNTALPWIRGDFETVRRTEEFLRDEKLRLDIFALERADGTMVRALDLAKPSLAAGEETVFEVVVRNQGVGHTFPGGTNDSNEGWIEFSLLDDAGKVMHQSGGIGEDGRVDPKAHFYRVVMVRHDGSWANERDPHLFHFPAFVRVIGPGTADVARFGVTIPRELEGRKVTVRARLQWRKFNRDYTGFVFSRKGVKVPDLPHIEGQEVPDLPVTTIEEASVTLDVAAAPSAGAAVAAADAWVRYNDHGIAAFLQGAYEVAEESFREVQRLVPARADGWRNEARRWIESATPRKAEPLLRKVDELAPTDPQRPYWWARYFQRIEEYARAEEAYLASLEVFPEDRDAWRRLGESRFKLGRYEASLEAYLKVLEIDPEDVEAHKKRQDIYRLLGRAAEAEEAAKAFDKYRKDDAAEQIAQRFLLEHEEINHDAQRRHVHR